VEGYKKKVDKYKTILPVLSRVEGLLIGEEAAAVSPFLGAREESEREGVVEGSRD